jgi:tRNA (adenine57-N1/adenine58-N1)-methyltransferase
MKIKAGDSVILIDKAGNKYRVEAADRTVKVKGLGVVDLGKLLKMEYGDRVTLAGTEAVALQATVIDHLETLERKAQIVLPKDAAYIILHCGIHSGSVVVEGGSGSGALTVALAHAVWPDGKVISYDVREEHQVVARRNVEAAGLSNVVQFRLGDVSEEIEEREVDAVVLDIPEPWTAFENAMRALHVGAHIASYMPTTNQLERAVNALRELGFAEVEAVEIILREMVVGEGGVRPSFDMLGHTGYICIARWVGEKV